MPSAKLKFISQEIGSRSIDRNIFRQTRQSIRRRQNSSNSPSLIIIFHLSSCTLELFEVNRALSTTMTADAVYISDVPYIAVMVCHVKIIITGLSSTRSMCHLSVGWTAHSTDMSETRTTFLLLIDRLIHREPCTVLEELLRCLEVCLLRREMSLAFASC